MIILKYLVKEKGIENITIDQIFFNEKWRKVEFDYMLKLENEYKKYVFL